MQKVLGKLLLLICAILLVEVALKKRSEWKKSAGTKSKPISPANFFPLNVEISAEQDVYSLSKYFPFRRTLGFDALPNTNDFLIHFRVSSTNKTPCAIVLSAGCCGNWSTSLTNLHIDDWIIEPGLPGFLLISATNYYEAVLPVQVMTNTSPGKIHFRMCFHPDPKKQWFDFRKSFLSEAEKNCDYAEGEYWSKEITITVVP